MSKQQQQQQQQQQQRQQQRRRKNDFLVSLHIGRISWRPPISEQTRGVYTIAFVCLAGPSPFSIGVNLGPCLPWVSKPLAPFAFCVCGWSLFKQIGKLFVWWWSNESVKEPQFERHRAILFCVVVVQISSHVMCNNALSHVDIQMYSNIISNTVSVSYTHLTLPTILLV